MINSDVMYSCVGNSTNEHSLFYISYIAEDKLYTVHAHTAAAEVYGLQMGKLRHQGAVRQYAYNMLTSSSLKVHFSHPHKTLSPSAFSVIESIKVSYVCSRYLNASISSDVLQM